MNPKATGFSEKSPEIKLLTTEDGSHTLYVPDIDESYHSSHGAMQESEYIFIKAGLDQCPKKNISVLEVGFGTGLNAFLTLLEAEKKKLNIQYCSLEKYPIGMENVIELNYPDLIDPSRKALFGMLHYWQWNKPVQLTPDFLLQKIHTDFTEYNFDNQFDVVFFDAFSPDKQPEMWTEQQFRKIFNACYPNAVLTTYCAKGAVRRAMIAAGFSVERLPGPPGKREILRARKSQ
jgi:tRNA U34 5-methylaminomethyl-2-thiouridine-forming methyltransferase MnmC